MSKRSKRNCVFCDGRAGSKEHALPDWLAKAMGYEDEPVMPFTLGENCGFQAQGDYRAAGKLITKRVCSGCNGGWMCELEAKVKGIIGEWVTPHRADLKRETLTISREELKVLNRWLIKTACCLSHVVPKGDVEKLPSSATSWCKDNTIPESLKVYAAWIKDPVFAMKLSRGFRIFNGGTFHGNQLHRESFDLALQLNHFSIRIANTPEADWTIMGMKNTEGRYCTPNFWSHGIQPPDSDRDSCIFDTFEAFTKVCVVTTGSPGVPKEEAIKASIFLRNTGL